MKVLTLSIIMLTLSSCDCIQEVKGTILDKNTMKPIDSVFVKKNSRNNGHYTNSEGFFELRYTDGGLFGCPPMKIIINKKGYKQKVEELRNNSNNIILLEKTDK